MNILRRRHLVATSIALLFMCIGTAVAHDLFIVADPFRVSAGDTATIGFHSGDGFPQSGQNPARLGETYLHSKSGKVVIADVHPDGKRSIGKISVLRAGYYIATGVAAANTISMDAGEFLDYLKEEGLTPIIDARNRNGEADKAARERYTKYAKSIFLVGAPDVTPDDAYKLVVGHPIEIVPEKDPRTIRPGGTLPVHVLLRGVPAAGLEIRAAWAGTAGPENKSIGKTDAKGHIDIPLPVAGPYRLHTIQMEKFSDKAIADWESLWATLTFEIHE